MRIELLYETSQRDIARDAQNLCRRLRSRYHVVASFIRDDSNSGLLKIAVSYLHSHEQTLNQTFEDICLYCEANGFGRVENEMIVIDSLDAFFFPDDKEG